MGQKITSTCQGKCLPKLFGLDYEVVYRAGNENVVADALSRMEGAELMSILVSQMRSDLLQRIKDSWKEPTNQQLIQQLQDESITNSKFKWQND